jgi:hypothetical protein
MSVGCMPIVGRDGIPPTDRRIINAPYGNEWYPADE